MNSFIDLMANDVWSPTDIKNRLHAEIRSQVTENAETELNRALQGAALGLHKLTPGEMASLQHFKATTDRVEQLGTQARIDAALLAEVLDLEKAQQRLAVAALKEPVAESLEDAVPAEGAASEPSQAVADDAAERAAAQAVVDAASAAALGLYALRNPAPLVDPEEAPVTSEPPPPVGDPTTSEPSPDGL